MMRVLLDTNVPLNMYLDPRKRAMPMESTLVMDALAKGRFIGYITPTTYSNAFYAIKKEKGQSEAVRVSGELLDIVEVIDQSKRVFRNALGSAWADIEDAGQYFAAKADPRITHLCTTNGNHFKKAAGIKIVDPAQLLALL